MSFSLSQNLEGYNSTQLKPENVDGGSKYASLPAGYYNLRIENGARFDLSKANNIYMLFPLTVLADDGTTEIGEATAFFMAPYPTPVGVTEAAIKAGRQIEVGDDDSDKPINKSRFKDLKAFADAVGYADIPPYPRFNRETKEWTDVLTGELLDNSQVAAQKEAHREAVISFFNSIGGDITANYEDNDCSNQLEFGAETPFIGLKGVGFLNDKGTVWSFLSELPANKELLGSVD